MKLRCYCCGEKIEGHIALVTTAPDAVDRVFVMLPEHVEQVEDAKSLLVIPNAASTTTKERT